MVPIPADIVEGALDYAAIGFSALASLGTLAAVGVAIAQTRQSRRDADTARKESAQLRAASAAQQERHHREMLEVQQAAREHERTLRLDSLARDAARESGVERVRLHWEIATDFLPGAWITVRVLNDGGSQMLDVWLFINGERTAWLSDGRRRDTTSLIPGRSFGGRVELDQKQAEAASAGTLEVEAHFTDQLSNRWRIDHANGLYLYRPRFIGTDATQRAVSP